MSPSRIPLHRIIRVVRSSVSLSLSRCRSLNPLIPFLSRILHLIPCFHLCRDVRKLALLYAGRPTAIDTHLSSYEACTNIVQRCAQICFQLKPCAHSERTLTSTKMRMSLTYCFVHCLLELFGCLTWEAWRCLGHKYRQRGRGGRKWNRPYSIN